MPDAETYLASLDDLWNELQRTWRQGTVLRWYTDHGPNHSKSVATICGKLLANLNPPLHKQEVYVLLAACILHDIGMQNDEFMNIAPEDFTRAQYAEVRKQHPANSAETVMSDDLARFFPDHGSRDAIAALCLGHSTKGYSAAIEDIRTCCPGGAVIRGDLLASVLLLADELDLQNSRAAMQPSAAWSTEARLHHHRHGFVDLVEIDGSLPISPKIHMSFPANTRCSKEVAESIGRKLVSQARRVEPIFDSHGLPLAPPSFTKSTRRRAPMLPDEQELLVEGLRREEVADFDEAKRWLDEAILPVGLIDSPAYRCAAVEACSESQALLEGLNSWLLALARSRSRAFADIDLTAAYGTASDPDAVAQRVRAELQGPGDARPLREVIVTKRPVILIRGLGDNSALVSWVEQTLIPYVAECHGVVVSLAAADSGITADRVLLPPNPETDKLLVWAIEQGFSRGDTELLKTAPLPQPLDEYAMTMAAFRGAGALRYGVLEGPWD